MTMMRTGDESLNINEASSGQERGGSSMQLLHPTLRALISDSIFTITTINYVKDFFNGV